MHINGMRHTFPLSGLRSDITEITRAFKNSIGSRRYEVAKSLAEDGCTSIQTFVEVLKSE